MAKIAGAGAVAHALPALAPVVPAVAGLFRVPRRLPKAGGVVLTFDDGPHPEGTPAVLEELADAYAPAVFFLAGEQVERFPQIAAEIADNGHEIALHCYQHRSQLVLTPRQVREDLTRGAAAIEDAIGRSPTLYRPPYGQFSAYGLAYARRRYDVLLWSRWAHDWRASATPESIAAEATHGDVGPGDVILLHDADHYADPDSWRATAQALPAIFERLASRTGGQGLEPR